MRPNPLRGPEPVINQMEMTGYRSSGEMMEWFSLCVRTGEKFASADMSAPSNPLQQNAHSHRGAQ